MQNWWPQGQELSRPEGGHFQGLTAQLSRPRGCREVKGGMRCGDQWVLCQSAWEFCSESDHEHSEV